MRARSLCQSFRFALDGLGYVLRTQRNARVHAAAAVAAAGLAAWLGITRGEWALIAVSIGLVLAAEIVNTLVESLADLVSPEWTPQARIAKDTAAAAVLVAATGALVVGLLILGPPLWEMIGR
jgi:diacylglycerol kinase